jgi:hypothetical protein
MAMGNRLISEPVKGRIEAADGLIKRLSTELKI